MLRSFENSDAVRDHDTACLQLLPAAAIAVYLELGLRLVLRYQLPPLSLLLLFVETIWVILEAPPAVFQEAFTAHKVAQP